jgi:very-short-patch-repair endonuclease
VNQIRTQAPIPGIGSGGGVGYVDLLIDGWLVIELDGDEWHEPRADKARDSLLVRQGFRSQRFDYNQVIHRWASTEATVMELLRYPPRGIRRA